MNINLWIPSLFESKGGIQVYSANFLNAIRFIFPNSQNQVFLKHDIPCQIASTPNTTYFTSGQISPRLRTPVFAAKLIQSSFRYLPRLIVSTHLNFIFVAWVLKKLKNIPYWTVVHGIEAWNIENLQLIISLKEADLILAVSNYTRNRLLAEHNLDPNKVVLLPNTVDSDRFYITPKSDRLLQKYCLTPKQPIILTVARIEPSEQYKGYDKILAALPQIRKAIPNVHYILVGKGDDKPRIQQLINQYRIQDSVTLTGFVSDDELNDYYNLCNVFAMPSKKEGFGIVYLEALACGKPTLGGNQDGAIDALCNGTLGALVNPDDVNEIAQTLIQILQGTYPNPLMYQPELLRQKVIDIYGFETFKQTLSNYLNSFFKDQIDT